MTNLSATLNKSEIEKVHKFLETYEVPSNNDYVDRVYKYKNNTITLYKTSVMVIQGSDADLLYKEIFGYEYKTNDVDKQDVLFNQKEVNQNYISTMGSDEVGVGDFFGGIVVVAAFVDKSKINWLKEIGVKDSKDLTDSKIKEIYNLIKTKIPHTICSITPDKYNELYEEYENSNIIKAIAHNQCLWDLSKVVDRPYFVIIDQFADQQHYSNYLRKANKTEFSIDIFETKAENKYYAVACASIIARVKFLEQIKSLEEKVNNMELPLGSSNVNVKDIASQIYDEHGVELLKELVKEHFITFEEIVNGENND